MSASVSIKIGNVELQCVGSEEFLKEQISHLLSFAETQSSRTPSTAFPNPNDDKSTSNGSATAPVGGTLLSVSSIAAKLGVSSGPDLIMAACLRMGRDGQATFKRSEIAAEMKSATAYFKATFINNLSSYLNNLVQNGKLLEQSKDVYALPAGALADLESKLA